MGAKMEFLPEQKKAIELRDRNILVSASAGAGKTAVLTERIISIILDDDNPVDIDHIVIVTFTRAAAGEMRSRIASKLEERQREADGKKASLIKRQTALLPHAMITTIDSFCLYILRNYFYTISLDPSFSIADENENRIMMEEVCDGILNERYAQGSEQFTDMVEHLVTGKDDRALNELVIKMYDVSESHPWPDRWLDKCRKSFAGCDGSEFDSQEWMAESGLLEHVRYICEDGIQGLERACYLCSDENIKEYGSGCAPEDISKINDIHEFIVKESDMLGKLMRCTTYSEYYGALKEISFGRFPSKKLEGACLEIKEKVMALRNEVKKNINRLSEMYFSKPVDDVIRELTEYRGTVDELVCITKEFRRAFSAKKREENVVDFGDIEHMALSILYEDTGDGCMERSRAAEELSRQYEYIMIDEYQDSNEVQEAIMSAISREGSGAGNMFMVGDVKQSIYRFRLAKPEIFEYKRKTYTDGESGSQRIILGHNFRSQPKILSAVNYIFSGIMKERVGGVTYDRGHMFDTGGALSGECEHEPVEVIYVTEPSGSEGELGEYGSHELEASVIAGRIRELVDSKDGMTVYDRNEKCSRRINYGDIVILLRSMSGWAEDFVETLVLNGIPAVAEEKSGYFSSYEIQIVLSMLKIIDNPNQDIPLVSALKSVFGNMSDEELALIRMCGDGGMYKALQAAKDIHDGTGLGGKCAAFLEMLDGFRKKAPYVRVYELVNDILQTNDFESHMRAMPAGDRRYGNLRMLSDKAIEYDDRTIGGRSLFGFLQSIERYKKASIDFGEAEKEHGVKGAVTIMSIHKSKGLEFPVVFVAGMGKGLNLTDINNRFPIHPDIGPAPDIYDYRKRTRRKTLIRKAVAQKMLRDSVGEELRVLYVAFTRPEQKLIMTGYIKDTDSFFESCRNNGNTYSAMISQKANYYSYITPMLMEHEDWDADDVDKGDARADRLSDRLFDIKVRTLTDIMLDEGMRSAGILGRKNKLRELSADDAAYGRMADALRRQREYIYPYENESKFAMKVSVSEIKHRNVIWEDEEEIKKASWVTDETRRYIPGFMKDDTAAVISGADRGTMYHTIMEHLDIDDAYNEESVKRQIRELAYRGTLAAGALADGVINAGKIAGFCNSDIAERMRAADKHGKLYREQPFVMGVPANMVYPEQESSETIIVQGIIDVFFEEEDGMVLLDYKTDSVGEGGADKLVRRYRSQMECYRMAIEKSSGKPVKEIALYSFALEKPVNISI